MMVVMISSAFEFLCNSAQSHETNATVSEIFVCFCFCRLFVCVLVFDSQFLLFSHGSCHRLEFFNLTLRKFALSFSLLLKFALALIDFSKIFYEIEINFKFFYSLSLK